MVETAIALGAEVAAATAGGVSWSMEDFSGGKNEK